MEIKRLGDCMMVVFVEDQALLFAAATAESDGQQALLMWQCTTEEFNERYPDGVVA